jgi:hypothetical protein
VFRDRVDPLVQSTVKLGKNALLPLLADKPKEDLALVD